MDISELLVALLAIFAAAKLFGELAERIGQPAVLGEMVGGIVIGVSGLHLIDAHDPVLHVLSEMGVLLLLFLIGLETDVRRLLSVGGASAAVAVTGVLVPFAAGYGAGAWLGYPTAVAVFLGAALTATSVGITARVLSDLGHLDSHESQVILGAAVVDDILGLVLLTVIGSVAAGEQLTVLGVARVFGVAFGFVVMALLIGSLLAPRLVALVVRVRVGKALFFASIMFAFGLAWLADLVGSGLIIGAFAAGLVLARTDRGRDIEHEVYDVAQFFIPIFFVSVGAAVDLRALNPFDPATRQFFIVGVLLTVVAIAGKLVAGYAAVGRPLRKLVIGVGMVPRGEVGLIFAQLGLTAGLLSGGLYSSVALMVMVTTFVAPPTLRALLAKTRRAPQDAESALCDVVTESLADDDDRRRGERRRKETAVR
ncbi:MAG TPA: cation:proton antiporter [Thermoanaerobaculia bacterium]|nr:cation:proton antiporter [Thermoanaerobaculia bacterium]